MCKDNFKVVMIVMHARRYFFFSLQLVQTIFKTSFYQSAGRKDVEKEIIAKLSCFYELFLLYMLYKIGKHRDV